MRFTGPPKYTAKKGRRDNDLTQREMFENVGIDGVVPLGFNTVGRILANWVIVQTRARPIF